MALICLQMWLSYLGSSYIYAEALVLAGAVIPVKPVGRHYYLDETMPAIPILNKCGNLLTCPSNYACSGVGLVEDFVKSRNLMRPAAKSAEMDTDHFLLNCLSDRDLTVHC